MQFTIKVEAIDAAKVPAVTPSVITLYLTDTPPDTPTMIVATEAIEERTSPMPSGAPGELRYKATIYREVELPTEAVKACFKPVGWKMVVDVDKAAALLAMFNYKAVDNLSDVITPE